LLLPKPQQLLPEFAEQNARDSGPEIEDVEALKAHNHLALHALDVSDFAIVESFPEAHEDKQAEHGVLEVVDDSDRVVGMGVGFEVREEGVEHPVANPREGLDAGVVENLGGEVAAEGAPGGAIGGGVNVVLMGCYDFGGGESLGAIGEKRTILDEGLVGEGTVGDEYSWLRSDADGDDGAKLGVEVSENWLALAEGFEEPLDACEDRDVKRARRGVDGFGLKGEYGSYDDTDAR